MIVSLKNKAPDMMSGAYRAVWRWHFYAGVLVMPFLMLLTLTGGLYLFK
ncbi:PepSY domain-containing protein, partial [Brevundimonas naejangsanensis]